MNTRRLRPVESEDDMLNLLKYKGYFSTTWIYPTLSVIYLDWAIYHLVFSRRDKSSAIDKFFEQRDLNIAVRSFRDGRDTVVFIGESNPLKVGKEWHTIASLIPTILPKYFEDKPLEPEEKAMLLAFDKSPSVYLGAMDKLVKARGYDAQWMSKLLKSFSGIKYTRRVSRREAELASLINRRNDYLANLDSIDQQIDNTQIELIGLRERRGADDDDGVALGEYIKDNKCLEFINVREGILKVMVRTYLTNFDPDIYERVANNPESSLYARLPRDVKFEDYHMLLDEIFLKEKLRLKVGAKIQLGVDNSERTALSGRNGLDRYLEHSCLPNPHIQNWNCFGNNQAVILDLIKNCDFVGALAQVIGSVGNLNFADGVVTPDFTYDLLNRDYNIECIEFPDGECLTARDAIERLKNEQTDSTN